MPQPVSYNPGTPVSGSIQENSISYVVDGQNRNYRGGFGGLSWMSEVPAANNVIFIGNSVSLGRGPANIPLFYPSYNNSAANIIYAANTLPGSPRNFTTTGSAYDWAATNNFFINNSDNPIPRIDTDGLALYLDASQPTSYPQTGTSVYDLSGRNNNGTLINGVNWIASSGSFFFDGTDDYVSLGNLGTIGDTQTIEVWFNSNSVTSYKNVLDMNYLTYNPNTGNVGPRLEQTSGAGINWIWSGNTTNNGIYNFTPQISISSNKWYHTVFTLNSGNWNWYLNGNLEYSGTSPQGYVTTYGDVNLGRGFILDPARYFSGLESSARIYSRTLSTSDVKQNYFQSNIVQDGLVFMVDANNLVSYPKSGTTWYNLTGSSGNALFYNGPTYLPQYGGGINRDNTDDFISASISVSTTTNYSVETWFKANPIIGANYNALISAWNAPGGGAGSWEWQFYNGVLGVHPNYTVAYTPNTIAHAVYTQNGTETKIYLNGILQQTSTTSGVDLRNGSIGIGNLSAPGYGGYNLESTFYNVRLYNKTLTSDEVQQNYQATKDKFLGQNIVTNGLVFNLDAANKDSYPGTGNIWYDLSGNGYNGTLVNGTTFLPNVNSGTFNFDYVDDYVAINNNLGAPSTFTLNAWVRSSNIAQDQNIFNANPPFFLRITSSTIRCAVYTGSWIFVNGSITLSSNTWYNLVLVYDQSTVKGYVNGVLDVNSVKTGTPIYGALNTLGFTTGGEDAPSVTNISVAQVYNRALSATEVLQNYNAQKTRFGL